MRARLCKSEPVPPRALRRCAAATLLVLTACVCGAASCRRPYASSEVSLRALETAPELVLQPRKRILVVDPARFGPALRPLGDRCALVEFRSAAEFARVAGVPASPRPDFNTGKIVGLVSLAGAPLSGDWPIRIDSVRTVRGAGLITAHLEGGSYLPDGTCFMETVYVRGLDAVLIVDINGVRHVAPSPPDRSVLTGG